MRPQKIMICAGEASGDIHGANLVRALLKLNPKLAIWGLGGKQMETAGVKLYYDISDLSVVGVVEVLKNISTLRNILRGLLAVMDSSRPDALVLIDNPGFNLRVARVAYRRRIPIIYYISPQVWAWGAWRLGMIIKMIDKMIVILPFEEDIYRGAGCDVSFVGHPILDLVNPALPRGKVCLKFCLDAKKPVVGLLPGSRKDEVRRLLSLMVETLRIMKDNIPEIQFVLSLAPTVSEAEVVKILAKDCSFVKIVRDEAYDVRGIMDLALVASGSATLENAILGLPMVILYKLNFLTWLIARMLVRVPHIGLVNLVAGREVVPEFIQYRVRAERIAPVALELLQNSARRERMKEGLRAVKNDLGSMGASKRAAEIILNMISQR